MMKLAVTYDPSEIYPPSSRDTLNHLIKLGSQLNVEVILHNLKKGFPVCDAIWIRQETHPKNKTYQLAKWAEYTGKPIIDDSNSIEVCCNKATTFLRFKAAGLPQPKTSLLGKFDSFPVVLKRPDSAFSRGVVKADNPEQFAKLYRKGMLMQEFVPTEFDWRVGILNHRILFVCKYFMVPGHWQIIKDKQEGHWETLLPENYPSEICELAIQASYCVGDGLYGVDIKETSKGLLLIEINDNPTLDFDGEALYGQVFERILDHFKEKLNGRKIHQRVHNHELYYGG